MERSAARNSDNVSTPLIIFHGLGDKVVPPNQSQMIYEELRRRKLTVQLFMFEGEQHNFRRAENIEKAYEAELSFFSRSLGLKAVEVL